MGGRGPILQQRPPLEEPASARRGRPPYALVKRRLSSGGHSALDYLGHLAGHTTTDQAVADPAIRWLMEALLAEITLLLPAVPGMELQDLRAHAAAAPVREPGPATA